MWCTKDPSLTSGMPVLLGFRAPRSSSFPMRAICSRRRAVVCRELHQKWPETAAFSTFPTPKSVFPELDGAGLRRPICISAGQGPVVDSEPLAFDPRGVRNVEKAAERERIPCSMHPKRRYETEHVDTQTMVCGLARRRSRSSARKRLSGKRLRRNPSRLRQ